MTNIKDMKIGEETEIRTLGQMMEMTDHQFQCFMKDLPHFRAMVKKAEALNEMTKKFTGIENAVQHDPSVMNWVYDDEGVGDLTLQAINEDGTAIEGMPSIKIKTQMK